MSQTKFRPSFTIEQIQHIYSLASSSSSPLSLEIGKILELYLLKVRSGIVKSSYITVPSATQRLELDSSSPVASQQKIGGLKGRTPQDDEELHTRWEGDSSSLSLSEIERVHTYRYSNDMMGEEEEREYEMNNGLVF